MTSFNGIAITIHGNYDFIDGNANAYFFIDSVYIFP